MAADQHGPKRRATQFSVGALLVWIVLLSVSLSFARYAVWSGGVLLFIAFQAIGAAIGAPMGYFFGEDRITGAILGALLGGAIGVLAALLGLTLLVTGELR
jgi:hypothetical protein